MQFTGTQVMVQHLVQGITSTLLTMPTVTLIHTPTLAPITLFQVEYKTGKQSWLGLTTLHLMRWRCFILAEAVSSFDLFFQKFLSEGSCPGIVTFSFALCCSHLIFKLVHHTLVIVEWWK